MTRLHEFFHEVGEALRTDQDLQESLAQLRRALEGFFDRVAPESQLSTRALLSVSYLKRLDQDVNIAAAWIAEWQPPPPRTREEAVRFVEALLSVLRVSEGRPALPSGDA